jgi:hypothetical protein
MEISSIIFISSFGAIFIALVAASIILLRDSEKRVKKFNALPPSQNDANYEYEDVNTFLATDKSLKNEVTFTGVVDWKPLISKTFRVLRRQLHSAFEEDVRQQMVNVGKISDIELDKIEKLARKRAEEGVRKSIADYEEEKKNTLQGRIEEKMKSLQDKQNKEYWEEYAKVLKALLEEENKKSK